MRKRSRKEKRERRDQETEGCQREKEETLGKKRGEGSVNKDNEKEMREKGRVKGDEDRGKGSMSKSVEEEERERKGGRLIKSEGVKHGETGEGRTEGMSVKVRGDSEI